MFVLLVVFILPFLTTAEDKCSPCRCSNFHAWGEYLYPASCSKVNVLQTLPQNITHLHIEDINVTTLDPNSFRRYLNLIAIKISGGKVQTINNNTLTYLTKLHIFSVIRNNIQSIPDTVFTGHQQMVSIKIENNYITNLQKHLFSDMPQLKYIYLRHNNISSISENSFINLPSLRVVELQHNSLKTLDPNIIDNRTQLQYFILYFNPWHCDKHLCLIMNYTSKNEYFKKVECKTPLVLEKKSWSELIGNNSNIFKNHGGTYSVEEGQTATLQCHHCSPSNIIWNYPNTVQTQRYIEITSVTSSLILENATKSNEGVYSCHLNSSKIFSISSTVLEVKKMNISTTAYQEVHQSLNENIILPADTDYSFGSDSVTLFLIIGGIASVIIIAIGIFISYRQRCIRCKIDKQNEEDVLAFYLSGPDPTPMPRGSKVFATPIIEDNNKTSTNHNRTNQQTSYNRQRRNEEGTSNRGNQQTTHNETRANQQTTHNKTRENQQTTHNETRENQQTTNNNQENDEESELLPIE